MSSTSSNPDRHVRAGAARRLLHHARHARPMRWTSNLRRRRRSPPTPLQRGVDAHDEQPINDQARRQGAHAGERRRSSRATAVRSTRRPRARRCAMPPSAKARSRSISKTRRSRPWCRTILGSLLQENYTISPNVTGNVTFSTAKPITRGTGHADPRDAAGVDQQHARAQGRPLRSRADQGCDSRQSHAAHRAAEHRAGLRSARVSAAVHLGDRNAETAQALCARPRRSSPPTTRAP